MIEKVIAFLDSLDTAELDRLQPARLRQISDHFYRWHLIAETAAGGKPFPAVRRQEQPKAGVLSQLERGQRHE